MTEEPKHEAVGVPVHVPESSKRAHGLDGLQLSAAGTLVTPDTGRVIIHFDIDCFYAQVEEVLNPALRGKPVGVTQKYLIVTSNYEARARGVTKLSGIKEALAACPELQLVPGEDLTPYRTASKKIWALLDRFGKVQRGGLDEAFLDATDEVLHRVKALQASNEGMPEWRGHVWQGNERIMADSRHRLQDLRIARSTDAATAGHPMHEPAAAPLLDTPCESAEGDDAAWDDHQGAGVPWEVLLRVGSAVAAEARGDISRIAGFRTSAGIACNKLMAKLVSGLHKPDDQTVMPPPAAAAFVAPLPVRSLPGVGYKTNQMLAAMEVQTVAEMRARSRAELERIFGATQGRMLHLLSMGRDDSAVTPSGPPKSITCEDSFKSCSSHDAAATVLRVIVPDLAERVLEEHVERERWPKTFTVKWRFRKAGQHRSGASQALPAAARPGCSAQVLEEAFLDIARKLLKNNLPPTFDLTLLNVGVTSFHDLRAPSGVSKISSLFQGRASTAIPGADATAAAVAPPQAGSDGRARPDGPHDCARPSAAAAAAGAAVMPGHAPTDGLQLCNARRDYAGADGRAVVSKRQERALMDAKLASLKAARQSTAIGTAPTVNDAAPRGLPAGTTDLCQPPASGTAPPSLPDSAVRGAAAAAALNASTPQHTTSSMHAAAHVPTTTSPAPAAAGAAKAGCRSAEVYSPATAARLREAGLIDSDEDCAPAALPQQSGHGAVVAAGGGSGVPAAAPEVIDIVGDTDDDEDADEDDDEALIEAAIRAESIMKEQLERRRSTGAAAMPHPGAHACASSSPQTPALPALAARVTPIPPVDSKATAVPSDADVAPQSAAAISPPMLAVEGLSPQGSSGGGVTAAADETPTLQHVQKPEAAAAGAVAGAAPPVQIAAYTPSSWGPVSTWSVPENPGLPGVVKYEAVDDYETDRTGSTLDMPDADASPAAGTPSVSCLGGYVSHAWGAGAPRHRSSIAEGAPVAPAGAVVGSSPLGTVDSVSPPLPSVASDSPVRPPPGSQKHAKGSPVVKLPSLRGAKKKTGPCATGADGGPAGVPQMAAGSAPVATARACRSDVAADPVAAQPVATADADVATPAPACVLPSSSALPAAAQRTGGSHMAETMRVTLPRCGTGSRGGQRISDNVHTHQADAAPDPCGDVKGGAAVANEPQGGAGAERAPPGGCHAQCVPDEMVDELPEIDVEAGAGVGEAGRVILHVDVDSFYCQVEVLDNPALEGMPIAVQQFNAGGFVAVSYEAKAAGVRKGDGVGAGGRANIPHLQKIGAVSLEEARRRCPGLQVLPMRTERYRAVSDDILAALRAYAADRVVQRQGYDDFYLDAGAATTGAAAVDGGPAEPPAAPPNCRVVIPGAGAPNPGWHLIPSDLARGCALARTIQDHISKTLRVSVSVGVARTRLLSRLLSPCNKPRGISVLPPAHVEAFMAATPLSAIPSLGGKAGARLEALGAATVGDLRGIPAADLASAADPALLAALERGGLEEELKDTGPRQSIAVERSFQATELPSQLRKAAAPLVDTLLRRVVRSAERLSATPAADTALHRRLPQKLVASWRNGYGAVRSKTIAVPRRLTSLLRPCLTGAPLNLTPPAGTSPAATPGSAAAEATAGSTAGASPGEEGAAAAKGGVVVKMESGGSQGERAAVATTAALEEVGEAITASVVTQIEDNAEQPLRITRISVAATFDAAAATHAGQQCLQAFLSGTAAPGASPPRPSAASPEAKLQAFFQAGASPPSRKALPFSPSSPPEASRKRSQTLSTTESTPPRQRQATGSQLKRNETEVSQGAGAVPHSKEAQVSKDLQHGCDSGVPLPAAPDSEERTAAPLVALAPTAATAVAEMHADAATGSPASPSQKAHGQPHSSSDAPTAVCQPSDGRAPVERAADRSLERADHHAAEPVAPSIQPDDVEASESLSPARVQSQGRVCSVSAAAAASGAATASTEVPDCHANLEPQTAPMSHAAASALAGAGADADGTDEGGRRAVSPPASSCTPDVPAAVSAPLPEPPKDGHETTDLTPPSSPAPVCHAPINVSPAPPAGLSTPPVDTANEVIAGVAEPPPAGTAAENTLEEGGGACGGAEAGQPAQGQAVQGHAAGLEDAVRQAHLQSLRGDRHDLDRRLALRLQEEELRACKRAKAQPAKAAPVAKAAPAPPKGKKGAKRGRGSGPSGQMQSLDAFFKGKRGR